LLEQLNSTSQAVVELAVVVNELKATIGIFKNTTPATSPTSLSPTSSPSSSAPSESPTTSTPSSSPTTQTEVVTHDGNFEIRASDDCAAKTKQLQTFHYITGNLYIKESKCTSLELNLLKGIGGYLNVNYNGQLGTFNANQLQSIGGFLSVWSNGQLGTFNANQLQSIGGQLFVNSNPQLGTPGLGSVNLIGTEGGQYLSIFNNQVNLCSSALQDACTSTTPVQGSKCSVGVCTK
jgi:hypothetical protein